MATVNKNFRIKHGLIVEGTTGTINGQNILTEVGSDQYILDLIGGETLVKSVSNQFDVSAGGELSLDRTVVDAYYDAAGSASAAQTAAQSYADGLAVNYDPAGSAAAAQTAAQGYADGLASNYDPAGSASAAQTAAQSYADGLASNYDPAGSASQALTDAQTYADAQVQDSQITSTTTWSSYKTSTEIGLAQTAAEAYTDTREGAITTAYEAYADQAEVDAKAYADQKVADLVDSAPALLDTLNELAAAIGDNPNYATDLATSVGEKVAKAGDTMTGLLVLSADPSANLGAATKQYVDQAEVDAKAYTDTREGAITTAYEAYADQAEVDAKAYTDTREGAITTAYEAYADQAETDAIASAQAALDDVLDATTPFTDLNINDVAKQVAARTTSLGSVPVTAYQFNKTNFKSGKFLVKIDNGTHNEISEILVTLDSSDNVAITEYAIVGTNGSRGTITADVDGTHCRIRVNPVNDSTITVSGTVFNA